MVRLFPILFTVKTFVTQAKVNTLNEILDEELEPFVNDRLVIDWNSVMRLVSRYSYIIIYFLNRFLQLSFLCRWKSVCLNVTVPTNDLMIEWRCDDWAHPGPLITDHFADMLLNYVCSL